MYAAAPAQGDHRGTGPPDAVSADADSLGVRCRLDTQSTEGGVSGE